MIMDKLPAATRELIKDHAQTNKKVSEDYVEMEKYLSVVVGEMLKMLGKEVTLEPHRLREDLIGCSDLGYYIASVMHVNEIFAIIRTNFLPTLEKSTRIPPGRMLSEIKAPSFEKLNKFVAMALMLGYPPEDIADKISATIRQAAEVGIGKH